MSAIDKAIASIESGDEGAPFSYGKVAAKWHCNRSTLSRRHQGLTVNCKFRVALFTKKSRDNSYCGWLCSLMFAKSRCGAGGASADAGHWPHLYGKAGRVQLCLSNGPHVTSHSPVKRRSVRRGANLSWRLRIAIKPSFRKLHDISLLFTPSQSPLCMRPLAGDCKELRTAHNNRETEKVRYS
jgi:hypothetical protein